jgi:amidohydrolase
MTLECEIIKIRRHIHKNTELSENEYETTEFIESKLKKLKISYKRIEKTGVMATMLEDAKPGKTIAIGSDIDALPIYESNEIECKSKKNRSYACLRM